MRAPPAFSVQARPGRGWRLFVAAVHGLAAAAGAAWAAAWLLQAAAGPVDPGWHGGLQAVLALALGMLAAAWGWSASAAPAAQLAWTGSRWTLARAGAEPVDLAAVQVRIDLDRWMLLQATTADDGRRGVWLTIGAADAAASWPLLRAALYSPVPSSMTGPREDRPPF